MSISLNLNLIIPFKDNKERLVLYRKNIETFRMSLNDRVEEVKRDLLEIFGEQFELTIAARSDGNSRKYYWRYKSSKRDRKYMRLHAEVVVDHIKILSHDMKAILREMEEELIYINANLKLAKGMLDAIDQCVDEFVELNESLI